MRNVPKILILTLVLTAGCSWYDKGGRVHRDQNAGNPNYLGTYEGMTAWNDGKQGVVMYSAISGEMLKWISYKDFEDIFVLRIRPEYHFLYSITVTNIPDGHITTASNAVYRVK